MLHHLDLTHSLGKSEPLDRKHREPIAPFSRHWPGNEDLESTDLRSEARGLEFVHLPLRRG